MAILYRRRVEPAAPSDALLVHCSSAPYLPEMHDFLTSGLGLKRYSVIAIPGGIQALTLIDYLPKFSWAGWRWLKFLVDLDKPARVVMIGHQDCAWYRDTRFWQRKGSVRDRIVEDLRKASESVRERFPGVRPERYYAAHDGAEAYFESV